MIVGRVQLVCHMVTGKQQKSPRAVKAISSINQVNLRQVEQIQRVNEQILLIAGSTFIAGEEVLHKLVVFAARKRE